LIMDQNFIQISIDSCRSMIEGLKNDLKVYEQRFRNAGIGDRGDYKNKIDQTIQTIAELETKVQEMEAELQSGEVEKEEKLFIYVISSTKAKIESHLGEELKHFLPPDAHSPGGCCDWHPYQIRPLSIKALIDTFRDQHGFGNRLEDHYIDGQQDLDTMVAIDEHKLNTIAIVDLLSIHKDNMQNVVFFNTRNIHALIIPFPRQLDAVLQKYMEEQRTLHFSIPERIADNPDDMTFYHPSVPEQRNFQNILFTIVGKKLKIRNQIKDKMLATDVLRSLSVERVIKQQS